MTSVSAADLTKRFGLWRDRALREPVTVTHHGRETLVLLSADEYRRLRSLDDRRTYAAHEIPDDLLAELERETPAYATDIDHLVQP